MKQLLTAVATLPLMACALLAQIPIEPVLVAQPPSPERCRIPTELGAGNASRMVDFDPDGDLLHDLAILWSSGEVTYGHAPEVMSAFVACPVPPAVDIERIPAVYAMADTTAHDGLLVATGDLLLYLTYDPDQARTAPATRGFTVSPVVAGAAWQQAVHIVAAVVGESCWIAALAADRLTVSVGRWTPTGIVDTGTFVAGDMVRQLLFVDPDHSLVAQLAVRTDSTLEFRETTGAAVCAPIAATTASWMGQIAKVDVGAQQHVAWLARTGLEWELRVHHRATQLQCSPISVPEHVPPRFRPIGLHGVPTGNGGPDALVLSQNTTPWQLQLTRSPAGIYEPRVVFEVPDMTYPVDRCAPLLHDLDNDGRTDYTIVLSSQHCVQIDRRMPVPPPPGAESLPPFESEPDLLPVDCFMSQSLGGQIDDTIELRLQVPGDYLGIEGLEAQVVAWPHRIADPTSTVEVNPPVEEAKPNVFYDLASSSGTVIERPVLKLTLTPEDAPWEANDHYYFMVRFVVRTQDEIAWSSPAAVYAFVTPASWVSVPSATLNYVRTIVEPQDPPRVVVRGTNRNVGVILKPLRVNPPNSSVKVPNSGSSTVGPTVGSW